jgi:hypothetical protein
MISGPYKFSWSYEKNNNDRSGKESKVVRRHTSSQEPKQMDLEQSGPPKDE